MGETEIYRRLPWKDRFNRPAVDRLREGLADDAIAIFDELREALLGLEGVEETLAWYGHSWYWTIAYRTRHAEEPLAVIIPSPDDLQLAAPVDADFFKSLSFKRMKRSLREGLDLAREPFHTRWAVWSVQAPRLSDDVIDLIEAKLRHLAKMAG